MTGVIGRGIVDVWDGEVGKKITSLQTSDNQSTASFISSEGKVVGVMDDENYISIFDIRESKAISKISNFRGISYNPLSFSLRDNNILMGTTEGPIVIPTSLSTNDSVSLEKNLCHKSLFISSKCVATVAISSNTLTVLNVTNGKSQSFDIPDEEIIDFSVNSSGQRISIISKNKNLGKYYLRILRKRTEVFEWSDYTKLPRVPYSTRFVGNNEVLVIDEQYFNIFNIENSKMVGSLEQKIRKYLK